MSVDDPESISPNALKVLEKRYLIRDEAGKPVETPDQLFRRVAGNIARAELNYPSGNVGKAEEAFYQIMARLEFLPNSPTLMNAGRELQQLSACFVLPIEDSLEGIFETLKQAALIHKSGGGTGFSFSRIRPKNDFVKSTGGVASGPVSFMKVFNASTEEIKQGGTRRGANMGILQVDHPDILDFIRCKDDLKEITNFNISVAITGRFMEAVRQEGPYDLINPRSGKKAGQLNAGKALDEIARHAHQTGEPGLFFIDIANETNPTPHIGKIEATNPCGEQPLLPNESCNLGSINLERHLKKVEGHFEIDWPRLDRSVRTAVHFLDNVIDMNRYPVPEIEVLTRANRKIGVGVMGFARMLYKLGIGYNTGKGIETGREVMKFIQTVGYDASRQLASIRGVYPNWKGSRHERLGLPVRNAYVTTVAPTGTIGMIADTSGGCEPEFSLVWYKNVMEGEHLSYIQDYFIEIAKKEGFWDEGLIDQIIANHGSARGVREIPVKWQEVFVTSHDIAPEWHVRMQAAFQENTDSAVSKTINLPAHATVEDVKSAFLLAYDLKCKGITVYRDGGREEQVMNVGRSKGELPDVLPSRRIRVEVEGEDPFYVHVSLSNGAPVEVFCSPATDAILVYTSRLTSHMLRKGFLVKEIIKDLDMANSQCSHPAPLWTAYREGLEALLTGSRPPSILEGYKAKVRTPSGTVYIHLYLKNEKPVELFFLPAPQTNHREIFDLCFMLTSLCLREGVSFDRLMKWFDRANARHGHVSTELGALRRGIDQIYRLIGGKEDRQKLPCPVAGCEGFLIFEEGCLGGQCIVCGYSACL
ncbi:MAG: adenosylcobalamin-dependent ribonucleoside-diphosphate reductase [Nitrospiria bacterium]